MASNDRYEQYKTRSKPGTVHQAAELANFALLEEHVQKGIRLGNAESVTLQQREDVLGMMPLHVACEHGQLEMVKYLIKKRVDLDAGDSFRVTAMHLAAIEDHYEIVRVLLVGRANVKPFDSEGDLPIHWAATKGHADVIELLLKYGSPIDTPNNSGWTPLHRAAYNGRKSACEVLVKSGASLRAVNKDGNTPLHLACFMNHLSSLEVLCQLEARQDILNGRRQTPMDLCITDAARDILKGYGWGFVRKLDTPTEAEAKEKTEPEEGAQIITRFSKLTIDKKKRTTHDDFPDLASPAPAHAQDPDDEDLIFRSKDHFLKNSEFLQEASQALEPLSGTQSPYTGLSGAPPGSLEGGHAKAATAPTRSSTPALNPPPNGFLTNGTAKASNGQLPEQQPPLPARPSFQRQASSSASAKSSDGSKQSRPSNTAADAVLCSSDEYQASMREENRRAFAAEANHLLAPRQRPISGNKKFLKRYQLDRLGLFAP